MSGTAEPGSIVMVSSPVVAGTGEGPRAEGH